MSNDTVREQFKRCVETLTLESRWDLWQAAYAAGRASKFVQHNSDCTIFASMVNGLPTDGICTCGYAASRQFRNKDSERDWFSPERIETFPKLTEEQLKKNQELLQKVFSLSPFPPLFSEEVDEQPMKENKNTNIGKGQVLQWIDVKDQLPNESGNYLVYIPESTTDKVGECFYYADMDRWIVDQIPTHWMHMPQPPKEK